MNENCHFIYEETEINPIDLIFYLLKQWKALIVAVLIGAVIGGGIYAMKKSAADQAATELSAQMEAAQNVVKDEQTVEEMKADYQISEDVESNMELAYQYRQLYRKQLEYNQNSPIMQMNPSAVYFGELEYYISAGYDTGVIALRYQNILSGSGILEELKEAADLTYQGQYIRELVGCSVSRENDSTININSGVNVVFKNATVTFTVNAATEENCEQMLQLIREKVTALDQECTENYEDYEMMPVNDSINLVSNSDYLSRQKSNTDQLNSYRNTMTNLENAFTEDELVYYNRVYLSRDYEQKEESAETVVVETPVEADPVSPVKWLVFGVFLMCMVWGVYYLVKYALDKSLKTPDELRSRYHLPVIGYVKTGAGKRKGLDSWLDQMRSKSWGAGDTPEKIGSMISAMELQNVFLCMEGGSQKLKDMASQICGFAKDMKLSGALHQSGDLVTAAKQGDGVILVVELGETTYSDIERELEVSLLQSVVVKGIVVVA